MEGGRRRRRGRRSLWNHGSFLPSACSAIASQLSMSHVIKLCAAVGMGQPAPRYPGYPVPSTAWLGLLLASAVIHFGSAMLSHSWQPARLHTLLRHEKKLTLAGHTTPLTVFVGCPLPPSFTLPLPLPLLLPLPLPFVDHV